MKTTQSRLASPACLFALVACLTLAAITVSGCGQTTAVPSVEYDAGDADLLRDQLGKMDWS